MAKRAAPIVGVTTYHQQASWGPWDRLAAVLPASYVAESTAASTTSDAETKEAHLGYAYFWWPVLNSRAYIALGGEDQFIYVDPASKTVVVKMSHGPVGPDAETQEQETLSFLDAASRWKLR